MNNAPHLVGASAEILADPRVQEALGKVSDGIEVPAAQALTKDPMTRLAKYGLTLRVSGLQHQSLIARIMASCPKRLKVLRDDNGAPVCDASGIPRQTMQVAVPGVTKTLIWLFTIAAPWGDVLAAVDMLEDEGFESFNTAMDKWFAVHNLTGEALTDAINAMGDVITMAAKVSGATSENGDAADIPKV